MTVYGYCRVSTKQQKIERQESNILRAFPDAKIYREKFTGTKLVGRKELDKILKNVNAGDTIVFDEVSRMSRNADEGFALYKDLFQKGVNLVFFKEPHISTDTYKQALSQQINISIETGKESTDKLMTSVIDALNVFLLDLVKEQIKLAFDQAQKEVDYLHKRTSEGMQASGAPEKIRQRRTGKKYESAKSKEVKKYMLEHSKSFGGDLTCDEICLLKGISRNTFYKYRTEIISRII